MNSHVVDSQDPKATTRHQWDAGARVLDVAAGAGDQSLDVADRVGPRGAVLATDLSPTLVARAQQRAQAAGLSQLQCRVADAEDLQVEPGAFDAAVCRLGLMLLPDPLQGLREMHRALRPGGDVSTVVFAAPERNPCVRILMSTALRHAGLDDAAAQAAWADIRAQLQAFDTPARWSGPNELLVTAARKP